MNRTDLLQMLEQVREGALQPAEAARRLSAMPAVIDLDFARLDLHREARRGFPEVIFCQGKRPEQVAAIMERMAEATGLVLATRAVPETADQVLAAVEGAHYHEMARCITVTRRRLPVWGGTVLVVAAGTADLPVAEEAVVTAEIMGNTVERLYDVGVAGLHRLLAQLDRLRAASVVIVVAGMEGALPSVVAGLVDRPVIAVPTSVGYGASFGGLAALLGMLNSCSGGLTVVNIDNGFGAAYAATLINRPRQEEA